MTTPEQNRDGLFMRGAAAVGDLDNAFYDEERQRDVWNEASAVGFQLMLVLGLAAGAAMFWIGGEAALPYGLTAVGVAGVGSLVTITYAKRLGVDVEAAPHLTRARVGLVVLLVLAVVTGLVRATAGREGFVGGMGWGAMAGGVVALACLGWAWWRSGRA